MINRDDLIRFATLIENCAQVSDRFVELRMRPDAPKEIHQIFGGGYYQLGKGEKCRGRVRLYGDTAVTFLTMLEPYFTTSRGERIRKLLGQMKRAA